MKKDLLNRIEEKVAFPLSRWFWHIVVGLGLVALVIGSLTLAYTFIPSSPQKVEQAPLPAPVAISKQDLLDCGKSMASPSAASAPAISNETTPLLAKLDPLLREMPEHLFGWNPKFDTVITPREGWDSEQMIYTTVYDTTVNEIPGFKAELVNLIVNWGGNDQKSQQGIVDSLAKMVHGTKNFKELFLRQALHLAGNLPDTTEATYALGFMVRLASFNTQEMTNDGAFFPAQLQDIAKEPVHFRRSVELMDEMIFMSRAALQNGVALNNPNGQYTEFSSLGTLINQALVAFGDAQELHSADSMYLTLDKSARPDFIQSLPCFYRAFASKNATRKIEVERIKTEFQEAQKQAKQEAEQQKIEKTALRGTMFSVIAVALGMVAFFSLMLVLLSIQRSLRQMLETQNTQRDS